MERSMGALRNVLLMVSSSARRWQTVLTCLALSMVAFQASAAGFIVAGAQPVGSSPAAVVVHDFNGDGYADFFDYDAFVAAFEAGC